MGQARCTSLANPKTAVVNPIFKKKHPLFQGKTWVNQGNIPKYPVINPLASSEQVDVAL
jgi:hypothetical protein